jgi:DNA polymerase III epsilon subunit-like protein
MEDYYVTLLNPLRHIPDTARRIHGIGDEDVRGAPIFGQVTGQLCLAWDDAVIVAHNAPFDLGFLSNEFAMAGQSCPTNLVLDTLTLLRRHFQFPSNSLPRVAERLGIRPDRMHRALADVLTTHGVFMFIADELAARGARTLGDFLTLQGGSVNWRPVPREELPIPPPLENAMRRNLRVFLRYVDGDGVLSERWVSPLGVRNDREILYLRAYCHLRNGERYFRLDRVIEMRIEG